MRGFISRKRKKSAVHEPIVRLVYERTHPFGVDAGVEPLIAVCATEEEAEQIKEESSSRERYASWEKHPLQSHITRSAPLVNGEVVHIVLLGGGGSAEWPDDPTGIAVYDDRQAAEQRADEEYRNTGRPGYHAISLPIGWHAED